MKEMYKGKVNSPATLLVETIDSSVTSIKVADGTVFPEGPNVAVIGTDGNAETIKYDSINGNILVGCVRGFQGKASVWDKDTIIARNFTEYDLDALQENILELDKKQLKDFQEDSTHRTVTDSEKEKWNKKVDQSQITGDVNASGSDKVFSVDFIKKEFDNKIDKSKIVNTYYGNSSDTILSQKAIDDMVEDFNNEFTRVRNNVDQKAGKDEIPTKVSQLTNDKTFKTEKEIQELINNSTKLKKEVVTSLPSTGKNDVIYLLKNKNDTNNYYTEYMWINGKWEIIGDTKVDLSEYLKTVNLKSTKLRTNKNNIKTFTDRSTSDHQLDIILGDLELRTEENKKNIKTKLSEMTENSTHRTVTDSEKESWDGKSRSATFVIANYDSSENSKKGADYVIQESDCAAEIINGFITKLPEYGGKIQLTEGNFNIKKNLSISFTKNNINIEGYGDSTNIIDKLTKDGRSSVIVNISNGVTNCRLSDLNITHETSNSINIRGNKNYIRNVNVINNGTYPSLIINDNTSENILENCSVKCDSSYCYWTKGTSENNKILNCSGTSIESIVFYIDSNNDLISKCTGTTNSIVFLINGDYLKLEMCNAENNGGSISIKINGNYNSVFNCKSQSLNTSGKAFYIKGIRNSILNSLGESSSTCLQLEDKPSGFNRITNCYFKSNDYMCVYLRGCNNVLTDTTCESLTENAVRLDDSYNKVINCTLMTKEGSAVISVAGDNNITTNCIVYNKNKSKKSFYFGNASGSKNLIITNNMYNGNVEYLDLFKKQTGNLWENNKYDNLVNITI